MKTWIRRSLIGLASVTILVGGLAACSSHRHHGWGGTQVSAEDAAKWRERMLERGHHADALGVWQRVRDEHPFSLVRWLELPRTIGDLEDRIAETEAERAPAAGRQR